MNIELIELLINTQLELLMMQLNEKIEDSSDLKGVVILTTIGLSFVIVIVVLLKLLTLPIKYLVSDIFLSIK